MFQSLRLVQFLGFLPVLQIVKFITVLGKLEVSLYNLVNIQTEEILKINAALLYYRVIVILNSNNASLI